MSDLLQVSDLEKTKLHNTFHVEAVTGKVGGLAGGADIDFTTNAVTGQIQKTLPKILNDIDWSYVGLFADGVTFTKRTDFALDAVGIQWGYTGNYPFTAIAGTVPSSPTYKTIHTTSAEFITKEGGGSVQDFISFNDPKWAIVTAYGADNSGVSFSTDAFMAAQAASDFIVVPHGTYNFDPAKKWQILSNKTWFFMGPEFVKPAGAFAIAYAEFESDFNLIGAATFKGNATASDIQNNANNTGEIGLYIESCARYKVDNLSFRNLAGYGLKMSGASGVTPYFGERGRFSSVSASLCHFGIDLDAGNGSEYNTFVNYDLSNNRVGLRMGAGNNTFCGGSITGNRYANVEIIGGPNNAHGSMSSTTINHAGVYNLLIQDVTNGFDFTACSLYGNSHNSSSGQIFISNSKGISISGGQLDCWVNVWKGSDSGTHTIRNCFCPGGYGKVKIYDEIDLYPSNIVVSGCYGDGASALNGESINSPECLVIAGRGPNNGQLLTLGVYNVLQFPESSKLTDSRRALDGISNLFITPVDCGGVYEVSARFVFQTTGTIDVNTSRVRILKNSSQFEGSFRAYSKSLAADNTDIIEIHVISYMLLNEGETLQFEAQINGTLLPVFSDPNGRMYLKIEKVK